MLKYNYIDIATEFVNSNPIFNRVNRVFLLVNGSDLVGKALTQVIMAKADDIATTIYRLNKNNIRQSDYIDLAMKFKSIKLLNKFSTKKDEINIVHKESSFHKIPLDTITEKTVA